jgi:hypothetical protein
MLAWIVLISFFCPSLPQSGGNESRNAVTTSYVEGDIEHRLGRPLFIRAFAASLICGW